MLFYIYVIALDYPGRKSLNYGTYFLTLALVKDGDQEQFPASNLITIECLELTGHRDVAPPPQIPILVSLKQPIVVIGGFIVIDPTFLLGLYGHQHN